MCGIIWTRSLQKKEVKNWILQQFNEQRTRGVQGFGMIDIAENGKLLKWFQSPNEAGMKKQLQKATGPEILFHHRFPTSTPNVVEATHPIFVSHASLKYDYYVVHNGVISNAKKLYDKYKAEGFIFTTEIRTQYATRDNVYETEISCFNDSEALAIDLAKAIEDPTLKKIESEGSIAFIVLQVDKVKNQRLKIFFGRNYRNPLKFLHNKKKIMLSSEGKGTDVDPHILWSYDYQTNEVKEERDLEIDKTYTSSYSYDWKWDKEKGKWDTNNKDKSMGFKFDKDNHAIVEDDDENEGYYVRLPETAEKKKLTRSIVVWDYDFATGKRKGKTFDNWPDFEDAYWNMYAKVELHKEEMESETDPKKIEQAQKVLDMMNIQMADYEEQYANATATL